MKYRIVLIETTSTPDHDVREMMYGDWKYTNGSHAEQQAEKLKDALKTVGFRHVEVNVEGTSKL